MLDPMLVLEALKSGPAQPWTVRTDGEDTVTINTHEAGPILVLSRAHRELTVMPIEEHRAWLNGADVDELEEVSRVDLSEFEYGPNLAAYVLNRADYPAEQMPVTLADLAGIYESEAREVLGFEAESVPTPKTLHLGVMPDDLPGVLVVLAHLLMGSYATIGTLQDQWDAWGETVEPGQAIHVTLEMGQGWQGEQLLSLTRTILALPLPLVPMTVGEGTGCSEEGMVLALTDGLDWSAVDGDESVGATTFTR